MKKFVLTTVALAALSGTSQAYTGNEKYRACQIAMQPHVSSADMPDAAWCAGYVDGIFDLTPGLCGRRISTGQTIMVLVNYMQMHPQELNEAMSEIAMKAFQQAWPCR